MWAWSGLNVAGCFIGGTGKLDDMKYIPDEKIFPTQIELKHILIVALKIPGYDQSKRAIIQKYFHCQREVLVKILEDTKSMIQK